MREIKFRGKAEQEIDGVCCQGEFVFGSYIADPERPYIVGTIVEANEDGICPEFWIPVLPETVGQFTGLFDNDNREIYEGDILEFTDKWEWYRGKYASKFHFAANKEEYAEVQAAYDAEPMQRWAVTMPDIYSDSESDLNTYMAVVGNVHDNAELLPKD